MRRFLLILLALYLDCANSYGVRQERSVRIARRVKAPNEKRVVCYYSSWAIYRTGGSKFSPEDIHPHLCTHILYAFATLDNDVIVPFDPKQDIEKMGFAKFSELKKYNPDLQLILSLGGSKEGSLRFSKLAADPVMRKQFAQNARAFIKSLNFDGLDLVWQYPAFTDGSSSNDKENYVQLVKELREEFKDDLILSMAVPKWKSLIDMGFDVPLLSQYLDFMNVLTYNYHEATDPTVNHVAPLYPIKEDPDKASNIDTTIQHYKSLGVDPAKLNMGLPLYGVTFILEDPEKTDIGSPTEDEGPGQQERGAVFFNELCKKFKEQIWTVRHINKTALGPYAYKDKLWMAYDDEDMIRTKASYAANMNLGGIMFWSIDMDDFKGQCHTRAYPLIKAGRETFLSVHRTNSTTPRTRPSTIPPTEGTPTWVNPTTRPVTTFTPRRTPRPTTRATLPPPTQPPSVQVTTWTPPRDTAVPRTPNTPPESSDSDNFPGILDGPKTFQSNRDIIFQNIKVWLSNHYYSK